MKQTPENSFIFKYKWLLLLAILIIIFLIYWGVETRILIRYGAILLVATCISVGVYSLTGCFTKIKAVRNSLVVVVVGLMVFYYIIQSRPDTSIRMQEDVLYIIPKSDTSQ